MRRRRGCSTGMVGPRRNGDSPHSGSGWRPSGRRRTSMSSGRRSTWPLAGSWRRGRSRWSAIRAVCCPGRWSEVGRVLAVMPRPTDLTPADTSSTVAPGLAAALRRYHGDVDQVVVEPELDAAAIAAVRSRAEGADLAVVGTIDGHRLRSQLKLVEAVVATGTPTIAVAMRGPWDVSAYPPGVTALATYSILPGSLDALAAVLAGEAEARGRMPVTTARHDPPRRDPRAAGWRGASSPVPPMSSARWPNRSGRARSTTSSSRPAARAITRRSTRSTCWVSGTLSVGLGTPSVISLYGAQPRLDRSLVVGISQSGASPDVVAVIEAGRSQGAPTLAITNDPSSALARAAETCIDLGAGPELAIAATKTYTTELLAIAALSAAMSGDPADAAALVAVPDAVASASSWSRPSSRWRAIRPRRIGCSCSRVGTNTPPPASGHSSSRSWRGSSPTRTRPPTSSTDRWPCSSRACRCWRRSGPARPSRHSWRCWRLREDLDAHVAVVSDRSDALALARWPFGLVPGTPEWLGPIVSIVIGQLHALHLARHEGWTRSGRAT